MAVPAALVTIELLKLTGLGSIGLSTSQRAYATARVGERFLGRSRLVAKSAADFDFSAEPEKWAVEKALSSGIGYPFAVEIWDDQGDASPRRLLWIQGTVAAPWLPGKRTITDGGVSLEIDVKTRHVPPPTTTALVPRSPEGLSVPAVVVIPNVVAVEFTEIKGLYKPGYTPSGVKSPKRSEPAPGYKSEDHKGRVFLNRDVTGKYARDTQLVEAAVKITLVKGALPGDAKVKWTVVDPDDPFDGAPDVHRQWAPYIDKGDYDASGVPTGMKGGDNEGKPDKSPRWEAVSGFGLTVVSDAEAKTDIVGGQSKVTLHCPNVAGDTLLLQATVESATPVEAFGDATGIMTLWHRIDVEYIKMASALDIPVDDVPPYFEPACAELNVLERTSVADKALMSTGDTTISADSSAFVEANAKHIKDPGWFFIVAAMEPYALPATPGGEIFKGKVDIKKGGTGADQAEYIEIEGDHKDADYVELTWSTHEVGFSVWTNDTFKVGAKTYTRIWLMAHDVQPEFTAGDGSHTHAYAKSYYYYPRGKLDGSTWTAGGYGAPANVDAVVSLPGAFYVAGISPPIKVGSKKYFGARTVMFTHHGKYYDAAKKTAKPAFASSIVQTVAHELVHAFGMPHKCGYFDYTTPRDKTCPMNYGPNWMIDDKLELVPGTSKKVGRLLCGRHLKEVRRTHLEDNDGLKSLGW